jgi:hypothetical protein
MFAIQNGWPAKSFDGFDGYNPATDAIAANQAGTEFAIPPNTDKIGLELSFSAVSRAITSLARVSNVVTVTMAADHGLEVGQLVTIAGTDEAAFHGTFTVASIPAADEFTYAQVAGDDTALGGTASVTTPVTCTVAVQTKVDVDGVYETKETFDENGGSLVIGNVASGFIRAVLVAQSGSGGINLTLLARREGV